jgi:hypothetical protein
MATSRKLGQIIAVRENTWMIPIPMGCDPETKARAISWFRSEPGFFQLGNRSTFARWFSSTVFTCYSRPSSI